MARVVPLAMMTNPSFDVIVVGARCAGAPTAMLLARDGYKVLLVDRARFPSDTISTHVVHPPGVAALARWGLLDRLVATGCPAITSYLFDFGPIRITGAPGPDALPAYCPRRTVLDKLLVDAAVEAGVELREGFVVDELVVKDGVVTGIRGHLQDGGPVTETAHVVVGADGHNSVVAKAMHPERYHEHPQLVAAYYAYWSNLPMHGRFETYARDHRGFAAAPTHDGLTLVVGGWPFTEFEANKRDLEGNYARLFELAPAFAERIRGAHRESRLYGAVTPNFFRKPYGDGWALVGDAGFSKDPITAQGISDAFRDAELVARAIDQALSSHIPFSAAMATYQEARDEAALGMYELTCQIARLELPPPPLQALLGAVQGNQRAMDGFCQVNAGALPPAAFFAEANVGQIFAAAAGR